MDKLDFFENMEPYEETHEAAKLLVELAFVPGQKYESIIKPIEKFKAAPFSSEVPSASTEIMESDADEEIVTAQVEEAVVQEFSPILPEPIEPIFTDDERERFNGSAPQLELSSIIDGSPAKSEDASKESSVVMHTLDSQQQYAKEAVTTSDAAKKPKQMTVEDFYRSEDQEPTKFEEHMVIEHTLPKIDFDQYLKEEDDIAASVTPEVFKPGTVSEEKTIPKTDKPEHLPEPSEEAVAVGEADNVFDTAQFDASKFVLDLPLETPAHEQEDFYMIDQAALPGSEDAAEKYDSTMIKSETMPESEKEYIADSFKDTDSFKISDFKEEAETFPLLPDESSSYTEITLKGELSVKTAAQAVSAETESEAFIAAAEDRRGAEFAYSKDDSASVQSDEESGISSPSMIDDSLQMMDKAIKIEPLKEIKYEPEELIPEDKPAPAVPASKEISLDSVKEKEEHFLKVSKTEHEIISEHKTEQEANETVDDKMPVPSGVEIDKLIPPDISLKSQIPSEPKIIEFLPLEIAGEKQAGKEDLLPPLLPFEDSKIKTVFKGSKKFQDVQLPPFEISKESQVAPELENAPEEDKFEQPAVKIKERSRDKEELEDYDKILAEAQKEAEEFIKDRIKNKQKEVTETTMGEAGEKESDSKAQDGQSFSDFLAKVRSQADREELNFKKSTDSEVPSTPDDHPLRPALDTPHVPDDIARMLPIIKGDSTEKSRMDFPLKPSAAEIEDLKYKSVPLSIEDKEGPAKEPKLKSLFSRLIKKKDKEERIE